MNPDHLFALIYLPNPGMRSSDGNLYKRATMKRSIWWELLWDMAYLSCGNILNNDPELHDSLKKGLKLGLVKLNKRDEFKLTVKGRRLLNDVLRICECSKGPLILMMQAQRNGGKWIISGNPNSNDWLTFNGIANIVNDGEDLQITRKGRAWVNNAVEKMRELLQDVRAESSGSGDGTTQRLAAA